jgi:hypothetical protein
LAFYFICANCFIGKHQYKWYDEAIFDNSHNILLNVIFIDAAARICDAK